MKARAMIFRRPGVFAFSLIVAAVPLLAASAAQAAGASLSSKRFQMNVVTAPDGTKLRQYIINGPPVPPAGFELQRKAVSLPAPKTVAGINVLTVPAYRWDFGCSAVSGAMIAGYYDRSGWADLYTGPTNSGVMPLDNSPWPDWTDGSGATYASCPLIASMNGLDGRTSRGSIDDYWIQYLSTDPDPYMGNWDQHRWGDSIGDYMKTSQYWYSNVDGSTTFYTYYDAAPLSCWDMDYYGVNNDGTQGIKQFYEAKGYAVADCYNQPTDNNYSGGFSFDQYMTEIDAGRPVLLNLEGHTVVGVGYDESANLVYLHDTWDNQEHTMPWGGSYSGMNLLAVGITYPTTDRVASITVGTSPANLAYSFDGATFNSEQTFISDLASSHTIGTVSPQQFGATRHIFDKWSDGGDQSHTITPVAGSNVYTANFYTEYELVTQVVPMGKGTVYPGIGFYREGTVVDVGVTPSRNYIFSSWSGQVNDPNVTPTTVTMTAPATVTANVTGSPMLTPSITAKAGSPDARTWTIKLADSGKGLAANVRVRVAVTPSAGAGCSPTVTTPMPISYGDIAVGDSSSRDVSINFSGCAPTTRFSATVSYDANGGVTGSKTFRNEAQ